MKKAIYLLGALFALGTASAQDSTYTRSVTTTTKKTERVVKKKRTAPVLTVKDEAALHSNDTINATTEPVRRKEKKRRVDVKISEPAKQ